VSKGDLRTYHTVGDQLSGLKLRSFTHALRR
jgi:hypothetical protein